MKDSDIQEMALIDEMKRRGRRRLIGAGILALFAIIVVPLLLEGEDASLGDQAEVTITAATQTDSQDTTPPTSKPEPPPPETPPEALPQETPGEAPKETVQETTTQAQETTPQQTTPQTTTTPADTPAKPPAETPKKETPPALPSTVGFAKGTFSVQLGAFTDDKGANALVRRLKRAGYPAYSEPSDTDSGLVWRVRVGPYKTRGHATTVHGRLKNNRYNGTVVPAR